MDRGDRVGIWGIVVSMEVTGCGFPADACAQLDAARAEFDRAHEELEAALAATAWGAPIAQVFREAAGRQSCEAATLVELARSAAARLRWEGSVYATDHRCG